MTPVADALADAIARLREGVAAGRDDAGIVDGLVFRDLHVSSGIATVVPVPALTVADLEQSLGAARRLPHNPSGGDRSVLFVDTLPADGSSGVTVLAEVDDDDRVHRVVLRPDAF